jgi:hypothetical protein
LNEFTWSCDSALPSLEFTPGFVGRRRHPRTPTLGKTSTQDRYQLGLRFAVKFFSRFKDIGKTNLFAHDNSMGSSSIRS